MVLYERILWSRMRGYYGLIREDTMVSHERVLWSPTRGYYGLLREDTMVSYERILWSIDGRCYLLCVGWQIRGVGDSVRAVKPIDETVARHFPGDFIVNWLFFSVCTDIKRPLHANCRAKVFFNLYRTPGIIMSSSVG